MGEARLRRIGLIYRYLGVWEPVPKPVYDFNGVKYVHDYFKPSAKRSEKQEFEDFADADLLPEIISGHIEFNNSRYLGIKDSSGNLYRFRDFDTYGEDERKSFVSEKTNPVGV